MVCAICGQVADSAVEYEVHKHLGHEPGYIQLGAVIVGFIVVAVVISAVAKAAPKLLA